MNQQFRHAMLPQTTHDKLARQNFLQSLAVYTNKTSTLFEQASKEF